MMTWLSFTTVLQDILQAVFDPFFGRVVEPVEPENVCPPLKNRSAGTPTILNRAQRPWLSQALTLTTLRFGNFPAVRVRTGTRALKGAHGGVKKSTRTGIPDSITSFSKSPSPTSTRFSPGLIGNHPRLFSVS